MQLGKALATGIAEETDHETTVPDVSDETVTADVAHRAAESEHEPAVAGVPAGR